MFRMAFQWDDVSGNSSDRCFLAYSAYLDHILYSFRSDLEATIPNAPWLEPVSKGATDRDFHSKEPDTDVNSFDDLTTYIVCKQKASLKMPPVGLEPFIYCK